MSEFDIFFRQLEKEKDITILGAWDGGSISWNLDGENSDYDIRFCFIQPYSNYVAVNKYVESIVTRGDKLENLQDDLTNVAPDKVELHGWDLKRFKELLLDNNPSVLEALATNEVYQSHPVFDELAEHCLEQAHPIQLFNHYQSSANKNYKKYIEDDSEPTVKKTLFIIRSMLMGEFIRQHNRFPDELNITKIHESISEFPIEHGEIEPLIQKKKSGNGGEYIGNRFQSSIEEFVSFELEYSNHIPEQTVNNEFIDRKIIEIIRTSTFLR